MNQILKICDPVMPLSAAVAVERIQRVEEERDLLQYQVDGWCVWPLLRAAVAMDLRHFAKGKPAAGQAWQLSDRIAFAVRDLPKITRPRKARCVVKTYDLALRSDPINGLYKDTYFDDLLLEIGDCFKIEGVKTRSYAPRSSSALIKRDITAAAFVVLGRAAARIHVPQYVEEIAADLTELTQKDLGAETFTTARIAKMLWSFHWAKQLYGWLFARIRPQYLFLINAYGEHAIVAAAKERGVQVVEFQHGIIHRYHLGYLWSEYAGLYRHRMPIPDRLFLYGEYWKQQLEASGFWGSRLCPVGSLRIDEYRQRQCTTKDDRCTVVLTTQNVLTPKVIAFMEEFLRIASARSDLRLVIKLHPGETDKEPYETALATDKRVQVYMGSESPSTFDLLAKAHYHTSLTSTCHYEALAMKTPTIILPLMAYDAVAHLVHSGHALLARTPKDLFDIIVQDDQAEVEDSIGEFYFKPGALQNMRRELCL